MGDRANFGIRQHNGRTVVLYGHWAGHRMLARMAAALDKVVKSGRIRDECYGTRIFIDAMTAGSDPELGWGITVDYLPDNEHTVPVFDFNDQTVTLYNIDGQFGFSHPVVAFGVNDFIEKYNK